MPEKSSLPGPVEVIDRDTNKAKPRRKGAKYFDTRSGRIRLAMIADNSAASIEAFVRANVKPGATLLVKSLRSATPLANGPMYLNTHVNLSSAIGSRFVQNLTPANSLF
jgi:hypothetical protein